MSNLTLIGSSKFPLYPCYLNIELFIIEIMYKLI